MIEQAFRQACKIMLSQIERLGSEDYRAASVTEIEQEAARRGLELLSRGKWKPDRDDWGGLEDLMRVALETTAQEASPHPGLRQIPRDLLQGSHPHRTHW